MIGAMPGMNAGRRSVVRHEECVDMVVSRENKLMEVEAAITPHPVLVRGSDATEGDLERASPNVMPEVGSDAGQRHHLAVANMGSERGLGSIPPPLPLVEAMAVNVAIPPKEAEHGVDSALSSGGGGPVTEEVHSQISRTVHLG